MRAQDLLESKLEPLYSMLYNFGFKKEYPKEYFDYLWKLLLQNQPHDSICGCGRDEVHDHMEDRYARIREAGDELLRRGMRLAAEHIVSRTNPEDYLLLLANTLNFSRTETVRASLVLLQEDDKGGIILLDSDGKNVDFDILSRETIIQDMFSPINLPGRKPAVRYEIAFVAKDIPAYSFAAYTVKSVSAAAGNQIKHGKERFIENQFYRIEAYDDEIVLTDKRRERVYRNAFFFEDVADYGDSYVHASRGQESVRLRHIGKVKSVKGSDFEEMTVEYSFALPEYFDFKSFRRSRRTVKNRICLVFRLGAEERISIDTNIENKSRDHRLRLLVNTGISDTVSYSDSMFMWDKNDNAELYADTQSKTFCAATVAAMKDENAFIVSTEGLHEYENLEDGYIALTLVRSTGVISRDPNNGYAVSGGEVWQAPGCQCLRRMSCRIGIGILEKLDANDAINESKALRVPILSFAWSKDPHKFSGGNPAVQDSEISEVFYLPDSYPHIAIPQRKSAFDFKAEKICVSAMKYCKKKDTLLLRVYNVSEKEMVLNDVFGDEVYMNESTSLSKASGNIKVAPYQIKSIQLTARRI